MKTKRRLRIFTTYRGTHGSRTVWLNIGGHKPLAHLPRWRRHLLHLPSIRWRCWPRPWDQHDAWGPRCREFHEQQVALQKISDDAGRAYGGSE